MVYTTKISKDFQTVAPSEIRKKYSIGPEDLVEWVPSGEKVEIDFRNKISLQNITGIVETKEETDRLSLKRRLKSKKALIFRDSSYYK